MCNLVQSPLMGLPDDLLGMVAEKLDDFDFISFSQVNRRIRSITTPLKQEKIALRSQEDLLDKIGKVFDRVLEQEVSVGLMCDFPQSPENAFSFQMQPYREHMRKLRRIDEFLNTPEDAERLRKMMSPSIVLQVIDHRLSSQQMGNPGWIHLINGVVMPVYYMTVHSKFIQSNGKNYFYEIHARADMENIVPQIHSLLEQRCLVEPKTLRGFVRYLGQSLIESADETRENVGVLIPSRRGAWIGCSIVSMLMIAVWLHSLISSNEQNQPNNL